MIKKATKSGKDTRNIETKTGVFSFLKTRQAQTIIAAFLLLFAVFLAIAFISFFFNWQDDQSGLTRLSDKTVLSKNLLGKIGAKLSHFFIYKGIGIAAFIIAFQLFKTGLFWLLQKKIGRIIISWNWGLSMMLWISIAFGFLENESAILSGTIGYEINDYLQRFLGKTGLSLLLAFFFIAYLALRYKLTADKIIEKIRAYRAENTSLNSTLEETSEQKNTEDEATIDQNISPSNTKSEFELSLENLQPTITKHSEAPIKREEISLEVDNPKIPVTEDEGDTVEIEVEKIEEEKSVTENLSDKILKDFGEFDPTLELSNFKFPTFNLLKQYNETISIDPEELEANKNKIVETLKNYKIGIAEIKATVGPTITLYEIVPEAGIRISKIKNLEDDIALSLSALGIRIIAPIPGKGTIGIEVPNKKSTIVSMHSVIASKKISRISNGIADCFGKNHIQ